MAKKKVWAWWMGSQVVVWSLKSGTSKPSMRKDKPLKYFKAGSRNMCENMAVWAAKNNYSIVNLKPDKQGNLRVWL